MSDTTDGTFNRREFVRGSMSAAALAALPASLLAAAAEVEADKAAVLALRNTDHYILIIATASIPVRRRWGQLLVYLVIILGSCKNSIISIGSGLS